MRKNYSLGALLLLFAHCCYADYIAAVVEYAPTSLSDPSQTMEENIKNYRYQIEQARDRGYKIIVFPEYGITGIRENPEGYAIVVPDVGTSNFSNHYLLSLLSDSASEYGTYIVVNLLEQSNGTNNNTLYYSTNVVFADNGTLVAKYRKINLYAEPRLTPGNQTVTFTTDFGTFGLMTCGDLLYYHPSQTLLQNSGVTDVLMPTAWTSLSPFFVSLSLQFGYALSNRVNLLASNLNIPSNATSGSGIYSSDGRVLRRIFTDTAGATNVVFANVVPPNAARNSFSLKGFDILDNITRQEMGNYNIVTDFQYDSYIYKPLNLSQGNITEEICHGPFCCSFNIGTVQSEVNSSEVYKLVAYNGNAKWGTEEVHIRHCNLVACLNQDISSCGVRPPAAYTTIFRQIIVWANVDYQAESFYRPSSLGGNLEPIYNVTYSENRSNVSYGISFNITQPTSNVVLFGLYGRSGVETMSVSLILVAIVVAIQGLF